MKPVDSKVLLNTLGINTSNIDSVVKSLRKQMAKSGPPPSAPFLWIPKSYPKLNHSRYQGKGRPRKADYDRIDFLHAMKTGEEKVLWDERVSGRK